MVNKLDEEKLSVKKPYFTFVWAEDQEGLIGSDGKLPWNLPAEMKHFVQVTTGDVVIMGRKSYESIPHPPLKNRLNIVLTRNKDYHAKGAIICHSKEEIMKILEGMDNQKIVHVIGGRSIFKLFINEVTVLYRTIIHEVFSGDTYMPRIDYEKFDCIDQADGLMNKDNQYPYTFYLYERKSNA